MRDAEATRNTIIRVSADLFNTQGYKATSISDITRATGYTKGAIYRHFENKQDLEQQSLRRLSKLMFDQISISIKEAPTFKTKFEAIFSFFENYMEAPHYKGGCPLMNAAVESDDSNPVLRQQAYNMLAQLRAAVAKIIENGIKNNQVRPDVDIPYYCTIFIATLEGGIMMSKLERNKNAIMHTNDHLRKLVEEMSV